jgi:hypothetical protein
MSYNVTLRSTFDVSKPDVATSAFWGTQTFWRVTPCRWVRVSRRFDELYCLLLLLLHGLMGTEHLVTGQVRSSSLALGSQEDEI